MDTQTDRSFAPHLSGTGAWAFALGTSIGWGSLVVTSNTYLAQSGPLGSVLGLTAGALIMLVICRNYAYLMRCYPEPGGAYTYCREAFGHDHAFLAGWFLALIYLAMLWANVTSLPLFARYFMGDLFTFGKLYRVFGYQVYLGEALLSIAFLFAAAFLCTRSVRLPARLMIGMVIVFTVCICICFFGAQMRGGHSFSPAFASDHNVPGQIIRTAVMSPWAFIGFESISHAAGELSFSRTKIFRILVSCIVTATVLYVFVTLLSVSAYPGRYGSWLEYIRDLDQLSGLEALPAFYAENRYLGQAGVWMLMAALLSLILTSLIGNIMALSRLLYALGRDSVLPSSFGQLNAAGTPARAIMLIAGVSVLIPFLGRTAIGWIVDVTTLGATLIYGLVSAAAFKEARFRNDAVERRTGLAGTVVMICFGLYLLVPNLFTAGSMEPESYFLFVAWAILGFFMFRRILKHDREHRFGRSIVVWIALLSLILFVSLVWMNQSILDVTSKAMTTVEMSYRKAGLTVTQTEMVNQQIAAIRAVSAESICAVVFILILSLGILVNNYRLMSKQAERSRKELGIVRDLAGRDSLTGVKSKLAYSEMEKQMNEEIAAMKAEPFALAVLDVNGLKQINDTLGHQAGDEHIKKACRMICMYFVHSPVYRVGGDEFVVLLCGRDYEDREHLLDMFRKESEAHIETDEAVVSVGCAHYRQGSDRQLGDVFERADALMYENKVHLKSMGAAARV